MTTDEVSKLDNEGKILAHYTSKEVAVKYILPEMRVRFNPILKSNDPFEYRNKINGVSAFNFDRKEFNKTWNDVNEYSRLTTLKARIFCCSASFNQEGIEPLVKNSAFGNMMMWDRYGDKHCGVSLLFNKEKLLESFDKLNENYRMVKSDSIYYDEIEENLVDIRTVQIDHLKNPQDLVYNHYNKYLEPLFFSKDSTWEKENEYRFIIIDDSREDIYLSIKDAMIGIVVGDKFSDLDLPELYQFKLPIYQCCVTTRADKNEWFLHPLS